MKRFIVQYTLPYEHRVQVGIEAKSDDEAIEKAYELFDQGDIWDDTKDVPLLYDDFEETGDAGVPLEFTVEAEIKGDWPEPAACVREIRRRDAAFQAARLLIEAYRRGEECGGSVDWSDLDQAHEAALAATAATANRDRAASDAPCERLAVVLEGGLVQAVVADRPRAAPRVVVVDYDTDVHDDPDDLRDITQSNGSAVKARVAEFSVEESGISLDEMFR